MRILQHISDIAVRENRDVLMVSFIKMEDVYKINTPRYDVDYWNNYEPRNIIIDWLNKHDIKHEDCFGPKIEGLIMEQWLGWCYVDVKYPEKSSDFIKFMENEDGSSKIPTAILYCYTLEQGKENIKINNSWFV